MSDINDVARALHKGPLNLTEWYFSTRLIVDLIGGSMPFVPEICLPTLRHFYDEYREQLWTGYGFRDAFNLTAGWWGPDVLGIDQGAMLLMIENHRTGRVWRRFMQSPEIPRGLAAAGFEPVTED